MVVVALLFSKQALPAARPWCAVAIPLIQPCDTGAAAEAAKEPVSQAEADKDGE